MPFPMVPAPSTATVLMDSINTLHPFRKRSRGCMGRGRRSSREVGGNGLFRWDAFADLANDFASPLRATRRHINDGQLVIVYVPPCSAKRSEEHTSELQSHLNLVCRLLLEKKNDTPLLTLPTTLLPPLH